MSKIDLIEECENEDEKYNLYRKVNCRKLIVNLCIVLLTFILITTFPERILNLLPNVLSDLKFLISISLIISSVFLTLFILKNNKKFEKVNNYKFHKSFYKFFDYYGYFVNTLSIIFLVMLVFITPSSVEGGSMENTLYNKDSVLVYHFMYNPKKEDIVVVNATPYKKNWLNYPNDDPEYYVKRCKAVKGDKLEFVLENDEYVILVNGTKIENLYLSEKEKNNILTLNDVQFDENNVIVSNHVLVISDNKNIPTVDSRLMGLLKEEDVIGKVNLRFYPFKDLKIF